jgi:hypothetical protein
MKYISFLLILSVFNVYCQHSPEIFYKSPKKYRNKLFLSTDLKGVTKKNDKKVEELSEFSIQIIKSDSIYNGKNLYKMSFGRERNMEYVLLTNDTLYYFPNTSSESRNIEPLFIFNGIPKHDTIKVDFFCGITNQDFYFFRKQFDESINDTLYIFKFIKHKKSPDLIGVFSSGSFSRRTFEEICISKKYGFIFVKYNHYDYQIKIIYRKPSTIIKYLNE